MVRAPGTAASTSESTHWHKAGRAGQKPGKQSRSLLLGEPGNAREKAAASCNLHFPDLLHSAILHPAPGAGTPAEGSPQAEDRGQWGKAARATACAQHWHRSAGTLAGLIKKMENTQWDQETIVPNPV